MNWCLIAVFLYGAALTHFISDLLNHWMSEEGWSLVLHCFLYTLLFILVFRLANVNYLWLMLIFTSHLVIDSQGEYIKWFVKTVLRKTKKPIGEQMIEIITLILDQILHLLILFAIALLAL